MRKRGDQYRPEFVFAWIALAAAVAALAALYASYGDAFAIDPGLLAQR